MRLWLFLPIHLPNSFWTPWLISDNSQQTHTDGSQCSHPKKRLLHVSFYYTIRSPHLRGIIRKVLWTLTTERKALVTAWANQERQIQGISLIKEVWSCNIFLQYFSMTHQQNMQFAASLRKSKTGFVLPPKGTGPLAPASLVECSHSLLCAKSFKRVHTQRLLHTLIQQTTNTEKTIFKQERQKEGWAHLCSHPWEEQRAFGSCTTGSSLNQK